MKLMIASDLHGSGKYTKQLLECYEKENANQLILLGDLLYHGPRNALPEGYDGQETARLLNAYGKHIMTVRGNCDSEVDQMMIKFPILAEYATSYSEGRRFYFVHGHKLHEMNMELFQEESIVVSGHTHVPKYEKKNGVTFLNPGSVSIPKEGSQRGYIIIENEKVFWKNLEGEVYREEFL